MRIHLLKVQRHLFQSRALCNERGQTKQSKMAQDVEHAFARFIVWGLISRMLAVQVPAIGSPVAAAHVWELGEFENRINHDIHD